MNDIIFIPGLVSDATVFYHQVTYLSNFYKIKVIVCDKFITMREHLQYVLNHSPEKFILLGHSYGGWIAQWLAGYAAQKISGLILLATDTGTLTPESEKYFNEMLFHAEQNQATDFLDKMRPTIVASKRTEDLALMNRLKIMHHSFPRQSIINQAKTGLEGKDSIEVLSKIVCPTLLIQGTEDYCCLTEMKFLHTKIQKSRYQEINHCGHMIPLEQPQKLNSLIQEWIQHLNA